MVEQRIGPLSPGPDSRVVVRPLGISDVEITGGPWARWQRVNRKTSVPLAMEQLDRAGNFHNLRLVTGEAEGEYRGPQFMDSDLYKTLEAVGWELGRTSDDASSTLAEFIATAADLLERAQADDGYLNSKVQATAPDSRYSRLVHSHELYCAGHLIQAAVASARSGGDARLVEVARRFADHLVAEFADNPTRGLDGHPEVETGLVELYRLTGVRAYLDLAAGFVEARGHRTIDAGGPGPAYFQDHLPVRGAETVVGHAVRALYLEAGIVDVYLETGDKSLLEASLRRWHDMVATKTYLTGGIGSRHALEAFGSRYELPPDRAYAETCAAIASIHWNWRLLLATGHGRHADLIERTLYNGFAASTSVDGDRFFYVNPLHRRPDYAENSRVGHGRRQEWYSCACCPPNIMRLVATLGHYVATMSGGGGDGGDIVQVHQYVPGVIRAGDIALAVDTEYPWAGTVAIRVDGVPDDGVERGLALRIPGWCERFTVTVAEESAPAGLAVRPDEAAYPDEKGYVTVRRVWQPGDVVTLELDLEPRLTFPHHRIDAVRGSVALERGPVVYCFEQLDQDEDVAVDELALPADARPEEVTVADLCNAGPAVVLEVDAVAVRQPRGDGLPYSSCPPAELTTTRPVRARAIPYFLWDNRADGAMRVWVPVA